ncbi:cobalt ECF transporter T component CbiQ [Phycicoccus sp. 3266]|uniref:cobalt ECF transporter T component CbiQ n=1 Tax=Phycicoccus sp. 3266 TaxID=2817751 RepID=UPI0028590A4D|nr:cobalt ECF transporter T component CbiQ [Phycicoccus sp. 3266]MDR6862011.1 cobalt ECF transporter T component CbiQ/cobalamin biosynthesis protein CbiM [Phycicoccus sp. 3266]
MHVPDGFLDASTSWATAGVATAGVGSALVGAARRELDDRTAPLAGLVAAFVFATQMLNFPVGAGTSGHLLGGALAAVLVGPATATLCLTVVLLVQGLLFADGGLTALGTNITLMGLVGVWAGYLVFRLVQSALPRRVSMVAPAAVAGAFVSVPVAALAFCGLYAVGGQAAIPLDRLVTAMVGWHLLIGIGEAMITGLAVSSILAVRPDLVHGARRVLARRELAVRAGVAVSHGTPAPHPGSPGLATGGPTTPAPAEPAPGRSRSGARPSVSSRSLLLTGLVVALLLAGVVSFYASSHPDGLNHVARTLGFGSTATPHASDGSPFSGYATRGIGDVRLSRGLAGVVGVVLVAALGAGLFWNLRRKARPDAETASASEPARTTRTGAGHGHHLHFHGYSTIHRLPAHTKLVALVAYVVVVVATPRELPWVFAVHAVLLGVAVAVSQVPVRYLARRMVVEVPFVVFALLLPFVATGPRVTVGPLSLSQHGLAGAAALLVKGTLGVLASLLLAATTEPRDVVAGLERLRMPHQLVQIMGFMIRYLGVVTGELSRMRVARESRGFRARSVRSWPALASTVGALFIRSYERGERVHLAMLSRGYTGRMPVPHPMTATAAQWRLAAALPVAALAALLLGVAA